MLNKLHTYYVRVLPALLLTLVLTQLLAVTTVYAGALPAAKQQKAGDCRIQVPAGWRPYRVQSTDTLEALVMQSNTALGMIMEVNCLTNPTVEADTLLILPALLNPQPAAPVMEVTAVESAAVVPSEVVAAVSDAVAAAPALLTIISTTETTAVANMVASVTDLASNVPTMQVAAPVSSFTSANLIAMALFVLGGMAAFFFALRPRADDAPVVRQLFSTVGNGIFLFAGVLIGVIVFPMVQVPSLAELPTGISATIVVTLIGLLVAKELFFSGQQWRTMNRLLNLGIAPLLMVFFLTVATRVAEMVN